MAVADVRRALVSVAESLVASGSRFFRGRGDVVNHSRQHQHQQQDRSSNRRQRNRRRKATDRPRLQNRSKMKDARDFRGKWVRLPRPRGEGGGE